MNITFNYHLNCMNSLMNQNSFLILMMNLRIPIRQDAVSIGDDVQDVPPVPTCSNFGVMYMGKRVSNLD